jgi:hypothetical protein
MSGHDYVEITATLRLVRPKSVLIETGDAVPLGCWIPRSCIHGADERSLDRIAIGQEITLRVFEWLAVREDLI